MGFGGFLQLLLLDSVVLLFDFVEIGQGFLGGAAAALFVGAEGLETAGVGFEGGVQAGQVVGLNVALGDDIHDGEDVVLLDGDLLDAPAEVGVVLQEFAGFGGAGVELLAHLLDECFVGGFFRGGEDQGLAGEAVNGGVEGAALLAFRGGRSC